MNMDIENEKKLTTTLIYLGTTLEENASSLTKGRKGKNNIEAGGYYYDIWV